MGSLGGRKDATEALILIILTKKNRGTHNRIYELLSILSRSRNRVAVEKRVNDARIKKQMTRMREVNSTFDATHRAAIAQPTERRYLET